MEYRTQKILLTGNINDEVEAYLDWLVHQSNNLYNSVLFAIRQAHFEQCETRTFFDELELFLPMVSYGLNTFIRLNQNKL